MALEIFEFKRGDTIIHKLDPRSKMTLTIAISVVSILFSELLPMLILFLLVLPLVFISKSTKQWIRSLKGLSMIIFLVLILNIVFPSSLQPEYRITFAITMTLRLIILLTVFSILFLTTYPNDLALALIKLGLSQDIALTFIMAVRFVPILARENRLILDAQKSRGLELDKGNILKRIRNYIPVLVPIVVNAIYRAIQLAEALESRAYGAYEKRTFLEELNFKVMDWLTLFFSIMLIVSCIYIKYYLGLSEWIKIPFPELQILDCYFI